MSLNKISAELMQIAREVSASDLHLYTDLGFYGKGVARVQFVAHEIKDSDDLKRAIPMVENAVEKAKKLDWSEIYEGSDRDPPLNDLGDGGARWTVEQAVRAGFDVRPPSRGLWNTFSVNLTEALKNAGLYQDKIPAKLRNLRWSKSRWGAYVGMSSSTERSQLFNVVVHMPLPEDANEALKAMEKANEAVEDTLTAMKPVDGYLAWSVLGSVAKHVITCKRTEDFGAVREAMANLAALNYPGFKVDATPGYEGTIEMMRRNMQDRLDAEAKQKAHGIESIKSTGGKALSPYREGYSGYEVTFQAGFEGDPKDELYDYFEGSYTPQCGDTLKITPTQDPLVWHAYIDYRNCE